MSGKPQAVVEVASEQPYRVRIGRGASRALPELVYGASRVAVIHPEVLGERAAGLADELRAAGVQPVGVVVPDGEQAKTAQVLASCWDQLASAGLTRNDVVVGLGGGCTTDLAGFVAASWLRGVGYVSMPTTVLAMVDAAVGGKTGINIAAGKNLVGAFHEPRGVLCDLASLDALPRAEVVSGLAEVAKCGFIADPEILRLIEADPADALDVRGERLAELVRRGIQVKATVVAADLRESTSTADKVGREALNYGHTLGHAIEQQHHFTWRHGEAISVGMVFVAELARRTIGLSDELVQRHREVLASLGLPTRYDEGGWPELRHAMGLDKKARGDRLRFVGLRGLAEVTIIDGPDEDLLQECFAALA